jgi:phosphohistidine phosphatase SixA
MVRYAPRFVRPASRTAFAPASCMLALTLALVLALVPASVGAQAGARGPLDGAVEGPPSLVVLVRHAEKAAEPAADPPLSAAGAARAADLARVLADAGITRIHTSDTRRTRDTVAPVAEALGLLVELYDPRDLPAMAARLRSLPGRHLVVGHSNTTDALSGHLGGATFGEIEEAWEYDRLYFLTPRPHLPGTAPGSAGFETVLVRFGAPVAPAAAP